MKINNINDLAHQDLTSSKTGETYSKSLVLTDLLEFKDIFVHHEILLPGRRTSAPHSHSLREEMVIVLNGSPTCHLGDQTLKMKTGDFVGFSSGSSELHYIENTMDEVARFLVICSCPQGDCVVYDS